MSPKPKPTVLVADDEEDIRASLKMILQYEGIEMIEAASGPEALKQVEQHQLDAMLLDIKMPRMDGLEVLERLLDVLPDFFLAAQFRKALERPQVMEKLLDTGSLEAAFRLAQNHNEQPRFQFRYRCQRNWIPSSRNVASCRRLTSHPR